MIALQRFFLRVVHFYPERLSLNHPPLNPSLVIIVSNTTHCFIIGQFHKKKNGTFGHLLNKPLFNYNAAFGLSSFYRRLKNNGKG
jgi:hypothetical protein